MRVANVLDLDRASTVDLASGVLRRASRHAEGQMLDDLEPALYPVACDVRPAAVGTIGADRAVDRRADRQVMIFGALATI